MSKFEQYYYTWTHEDKDGSSNKGMKITAASDDNPDAGRRSGIDSFRVFGYGNAGVLRYFSYDEIEDTFIVSYISPIEPGKKPTERGDPFVHLYKYKKPPGKDISEMRLVDFWF